MSRFKILSSLVVLVLAVALIGGVTIAWFMAKADAPINEFIAGTLLISADVEDFQDEDNWNPGETREAKYNIKNEGSKCSFLRASFEGRWYCECGSYLCNTAMVRMNDEPDDFTYRWPDHPWFTYIIHKPTTDVETFFFYASQTHRVGEIDIWKDDNNLYIEINLDNSPPGEYVMSESQVNIRTSEAGLTALPGNGLSFGLWDENEPHEPETDSYTHVIPWNSDWNDQELYIGVHAGVCGYYFSTDNGECVEFCPPHYDEHGLVEVVSFEPCNDNWVAGDDGYLYYVGADNCLEGLLAGETAQLCVDVKLDREKTDDRYQGKEFRFEASFEAIQCSNNAALENDWPFFCDNQ